MHERNRSIELASRHVAEIKIFGRYAHQTSVPFISIFLENPEQWKGAAINRANRGARLLNP